MTGSRIYPIIAAIFAGIGCTTTAPPEIRIVEVTAAERGAELFRDPSIAASPFNVYACSTCHEETPGAASPAILPGAPLAGVPSRPSYWGGAELELLRSINHCFFYFMLQDEPWTREDEDAKLLYAYLASLSSQGGSDAVPFTVVQAVEAPPVGDGARGEGVYERACASCHGAPHSGASKLVPQAPVLPDHVLLEHPLDEYTEEERRLVFVEKIRHGGFAGQIGQMPPFSKERLSDQDIGDLLAFLGVP